MHSPLLAIGRLSVYLVLTLLVIPSQYLAVRLKSRYAKVIPRIYHRLVCRCLLGARLDVRGRMSQAEPTLFVANHSSYIDIEILGALIEGSFIAKREVADWPFFGMLAKLQRTIFVDRRPGAARAQRQEMMRRLEAGDSLILFPEGTSNDGNRTYAFKSALFSVAEFEKDGEPITVQPVSIAYTHLDGIPLGRHYRPFVAWYGDMELAGHLWQLIGLGHLTVRVVFHHPVTLRDMGSRKALADHCQNLVAAGVTSALYGRPMPSVPSQRAA